MIKITVDTSSSSEFNSEEHFCNSLIDLLQEWHEACYPKEMDNEDAGFNSDRFNELMKVLHFKNGSEWDEDKGLTKL